VHKHTEEEKILVHFRICFSSSEPIICLGSWFSSWLNTHASVRPWSKFQICMGKQQNCRLGQDVFLAAQRFQTPSSLRARQWLQRILPRDVSCQNWERSVRGVAHGSEYSRLKRRERETQFMGWWLKSSLKRAKKKSERWLVLHCVDRFRVIGASDTVLRNG
jgi:hypothetical protein